MLQEAAAYLVMCFERKRHGYFRLAEGGQTDSFYSKFAAYGIVSRLITRGQISPEEAEPLHEQIRKSPLPDNPFDTLAEMAASIPLHELQYRVLFDELEDTPPHKRTYH